MRKISQTIICAFVTIKSLAQVKTDEAKRQADAAATTLKTTKEIPKDGWTKAGTLNLTITQGGRNEYWIRGGEKQSLGIRAIVDVDVDYKKGKVTVLNSIRARYGLLKATSTGNAFFKNDDFLNITSIYGSSLKNNWNMAALASLETQFDGYFLSPGYLKFGPGFMYQKNAKFSLLVSPLMANLTTKLATEQKLEALFGVDAGKTSRFGVGAFAQAKGSYNLGKNVAYKFFATAFSDYKNKPELIIFDCTNLLTMNVNKYIGTTISLNLRYNDWEVGKLQTQYSLGVGLSYKL
jgi:hypothetical protein